ncbi:MAG: TonB-dependent receptor plug domain-containing protein [Reichenbachiella sp.]|uniref:TonB-dependent receptor plug domain-containing protein n=1 Tax=Reichenbachiella sp. TaxID=2184521 RepID=UPI0032972269
MKQAKNILFNLILTLSTFSSSLLLGQAVEEDIFDLSLEELMNMEVSVGSANKLTLKETPGIVTVISKKEIKNSGARDMIDILRLVPGFEFSGEIENTIGLGVRGNHAMEGKALILIDGQQINEIGYGTVMFGNRFMVDNIQKIEVIRGPGSAIYGGLAELAVINIITNSGKDINGGYASASYGSSNGTTSRMTAQFGVGTITESGMELSLTGGVISANRSNEEIYYPTNTLDAENGAPATFNYADSSKIKSYDLNLGLKYKGLSIKAIYQDYGIQENTNNSDWVIEGGIYLGAEYDWQISEKLTLTPEISWKKEHPWSYRGNISDDNYNYYVANTYRTKGNLTGLWKATDKFHLTFGGEITADKAKKPSGAEPFINGSSEVSYSNVAGFSELLIKSSVANIIIGARFDHHSKFGSAFVPRFAITKSWDKFHVKGLLSRAFKAPVIYNFEADPNINAEYTNVTEIEAGYLFNNAVSLTGNLFYIKIEDPILYFYDPVTESDNYLNFNSASTIGVEMDFRINKDWGYLNSTYSYYQNNNTDAAPYEVDDNDKLLRGFPAHKFTLAGGINLTDQFTVAPTLIFNSEKEGYFAQGEYWSGEGFYTYDSNTILNLALHYDVAKQLELSLIGYDLFNDSYVTANAYDAWYAGTPTMGREFVLKAIYSFNK